LKENVYATDVQDCCALINCIVVAVADIKIQPRQLATVRDSIQCCCEAYVQGREDTLNMACDLHSVY
jgi:hypothetical protein